MRRVRRVRRVRCGGLGEVDNLGDEGNPGGVGACRIAGPRQPRSVGAVWRAGVETIGGVLPVQ